MRIVDELQGNQRSLHYRDTIEPLNKRWTWQIVRLLLNEPLHFNDLKKHIDHISAQILSTRIKELMQEGIVRRCAISGPPVQVEYGLTDKGYELRPVIEAIISWSSCFIIKEESKYAFCYTDEGE